MSTVTDLPGNITLDLDELERDPKQVRPPFVTVIGGRQVTFSDPEDADWQDLYDVADPYGLLRVAVTPEDRAHILEQKMPTWKFEKLMQAYNQHFGLEDKIAEARRRNARAGL
jgi:hypothetical protein